MYQTLEDLAKALINYLQKEGLICSKPSEGTKKKKITNIWFDEDTNEFVLDYE